ncbi:MAG: LacI family DNA-binding transcriptional regulator, partial [Rhodothermales bacterium]|nr:LacI family DNA-binding transcriptional regulator [Rhodothermales bacterium]
MGVTIYDIAERAKVSIATVSRVLNNNPRVSAKTRSRVLEVAQELGYEPHPSARSLARRRSSVVSAVIPMVTNYFFMEVLRGLQDRLGQSEFDLLVYTARTVEEVGTQLDRALHRGRSAGVLLFSTPIGEHHIARMRRFGQPVVLVDCSHPEFDSV